MKGAPLLKTTAATTESLATAWAAHSGSREICVFMPSSTDSDAPWKAVVGGFAESALSLGETSSEAVGNVRHLQALRLVAGRRREIGGIVMEVKSCTANALPDISAFQWSAIDENLESLETGCAT